MGQNGLSDNCADTIRRINSLGAKRRPFLFVLDYALESTFVIPLDEISERDILFQINGLTNATGPASTSDGVILETHPMSFAEYQKAFDQVMAELQYGNSFLLNLTCRTAVSVNIPLRDIFMRATARYRLWFKDQFVVFSPETFVKIRRGRISSFPMKGTIDATIPNAEKIILENKKEAAEHITIVDLIRNDLSQVSSDVRVDRFRYVEEVVTHRGALLQVSSAISGMLPEDYHRQLGDILVKLLPAGSISGAPKRKTVEILAKAENFSRGYFTGVAGIFDGQDLDSMVMIRFIEKDENQLYYKSGGGITALSTAEEEYDEMLKKIYVPIH